MPTGIGSGIAGDVFQNLLGDGSGGGGGLVCPSRYSWLGDGIGLGGPWGSVTVGAYILGATSSSASIWYKPIDRRGATNLGAGLYSSNASGASFTSGTNIFTSPSGVLTASLGPMTFPAHPELITNGSFSNVPVGTELIANPTFSDAASITPWSITGAPNATLTWNARFMRMTYTVADGDALFDNLGQTLNAMYSVKMRVRGVTSAGADQGSAFDKIGDDIALTSANIISNPTLTSEYQDYEFRVWSTDISFRLYLASAAIGDVVDFDSISIKPLDMIITNGNFAVAGSWSNGTISGGQFTKTDSGLAYQAISVTEGKSYRAVVDVASLDGATQFWLKGTSSANLVVGENIIYIIAGSSTSNYAAFNNGYSTSTGSVINSVSLEELGEDWNDLSNPLAVASFGENGLTITSVKGDGNFNRVYQTNVTEDSKSYKVTYTIHSATLTGSNVFQYYNGQAFITLPTAITGTPQTFYFTRKATDDNWYFRVATYNGSTTDTVTISSISVEEVLSENEWHHLALSIDRDSEWKWYVDGVLTNTMDNATDVAPLLGISSLGLTNVSTAITSFYGNMTEPSLWNIPLSASEVKDIYDNMYGGQRCLGSLPFTSDLITNGNFTQIGPELITNPNFTDTGSELVVNGDFATDTDWAKNGGATISGGKAIIDGDGLSFTNISQSNIFTQGNSYIVTADVIITSGLGLKFQSSGVNENIGFATTSGSYTFYFVAPNNAAFVIGRRFANTAFESSVDNVSIKELGEDWTAYTSGASTVEYNSSGANLLIDSAANGGSNVGVYQENIFELGKSYKIVLSMKATASFDAEVVESDLAATENVIGTVSLTTSFQDFTFYYVGTGTFDLFIHRLFNGGGASQTISIQSVVVQEVGQGWTVANRDATHYVEFPGVGARFVAPTLSPVLELQQLGIITPGKSYTVTCHVAYAVGSGGLRCQVGGTNSTPFTEGFNTKTVTAGVGTDFSFLGDAANVDCVITNVTLTQVGGGNLERWWRMNGLEPLLITLPNVAPNGTVNDCIPSGTPIIQLDTP
jgi:hypothetical protein